MPTTATTLQNFRTGFDKLVTAIRRFTRSYFEFVFEHPVFFLLPYLFLYLLAQKTSIETSTFLQYSHILNALFLAAFLSQIPVWRRTSSFWFFLALFLMFFFTGCYFEYPSDTWAHYERITRWKRLTQISLVDDELERRFYYLWQWSITSLVSVSQRRSLIDLLSAFSQLLLVIEVYRLAQKLALRLFWKAALILLFMSTYGHSLFGIRYYGISSTNISYAAYLFLLGECITLKQLDIRKALMFCSVLLFLYFNHKPEFHFALFALIMTGGIALLKHRWKDSQINVGLIVVSLTLVLVDLLAKPHIPSIFTSSGFRAYSLVGLFTVVAPIVTLITFQTFPPLLFSLGLIPALVNTNTFFAKAVLSAVPTPEDVLRVYWVLPAALSWIFFFRLIEDRIQNTLSIRTFRVLSLGFVLIAGFSPDLPWRGKLWFQFHQADPIRELKGTEVLADWFSKNRKTARTPLYLTDDITHFALNAHLGWELPHARLHPHKINAHLTNPEAIKSRLAPPSGPAFVLLPITALVGVPAPSAVGTKLGWPDVIETVRDEIGPAFERSLNDVLDERGWSRIFVPPHFLYREPAPP